jgi:hypothetical protein
MEPTAQSLAALGIVGIALFLFIFIVLLLYFTPAFCAFIRGTRHRWAIAFLNLFLGWSLIGWFICLVWAFVDDPKERCC